jgi:hypothetical protein
MIAPPIAVTQRQRAANGHLMPIVKALQKQSHLEQSAGV